MRLGTQSIERAVVLLKELAARSNFGWRLSDLAARCELDQSTAHRILACLLRERLVQQRKRDHHYLLGPLLIELSLALPGPANFRAACQAPLSRIAHRTRGVACLYLRSGAEFVCAARVGSSPLKGLTVQVGTRQPLITSAGGVAMLLAIPLEESRAVVAANMKHVASYGEVRIRALEKMLQRSHKYGYGINLGDVVPGIHAFGIAIRDADDQPFAALTVSGAAEDFPASELSTVVAVLEEERGHVARAAASVLADGPAA
jgi:DNA-binding IclR family transcriptional regulator